MKPLHLAGRSPIQAVLALLEPGEPRMRISRRKLCRQPRTSLVSFSLLFLTASCGPAESPAIRVVARDSAGVSIVQNLGTEESTVTTWFVSEEPSTLLGGHGQVPTLFRVAGGLILSDGTIAVANQGSGEILFFDGSGTLLGTQGRVGEGPGEYKRPVLMGTVGGDTLVVADSDNRRISLIHPRTGFLSSNRIGDELGPTVSARGMFSDGSLVVGGGYSWDSRSGGVERPGYSRPHTTYRSTNLNGRMVTDFGSFPGAEFNISVRRLPGGESSMSADLIPFAKHPSVAAGAGQLYVGTRDEWEILVFDPQGHLRRILRMDRVPLAVEAEDLEALIRGDIERAGDPTAEASIRRRYAETFVPETMPAFSQLKVDDLGYLWVERYRRPGDLKPVFDVLNPEGALVTQISIPEGNRILQVGEDFVLAVHRDELDVETVRLYHLTRG